MNPSLSKDTDTIAFYNGFQLKILDSDKVEMQDFSFENDSVGILFYYDAEECEVSIEASKIRYLKVNAASIAIFSLKKGERLSHFVKEGSHLRALCITTSIDKIQDLPEEGYSSLQGLLNGIIDNESSSLKRLDFFMNTQIRDVANKIFTHNFEGLLAPLFVKSQLIELLAKLIFTLDENHSIRKVKNINVKLELAKKLLTENLDRPPSLQELAKQIGMSPTKLKKDFKLKYGIPVFKLLKNERLIKAHELISMYGYSIKHAAYSVGYESVGSFSNAFTQKFGKRPSTFRKEELALN